MKILVGYRGANVGYDMLQLAAKHAQAFAAEVILMTSLEGGQKTTQGKIREAETNLESAKKILGDQGVSCETHLLVRGHTAGEDIVTFAYELDCSEIIIGVKSRSKVGKLMFGSTAQHVVLQAACPVVTIK